MGRYPYSSKWRDEISKAVEGTSTFICILSPDYFSSKTCLDELNLAESHNKRIVPTLHKEFDAKLNSSNSVSKINWLFVRDEDDFTKSFNSLIETINKDLDWVNFHAGLLVRAIEWKNKKNDSSYHLYGKNLEEAESLAKKGSKSCFHLIPYNIIILKRPGVELPIFRENNCEVLCSGINLFHRPDIVIYFWSFNSISETGMINLSWVWLPGLSFAIAGCTIGKYSIRKSFIAMAVVMVVFFLFFTILWESL